jgi:hypothetical protein
VLGDSPSDGTSAAPVAVTDGADHPAVTDGQDGVVSGNQVAPDATAPVAVTGNSVSLLGDSSSGDSSAAPVAVTDGADQAAMTDGTDGVVSGNQVAPDATAPVAVTGNSVSVLGDSSSDGTSATPVAVTNGADQAATTNGQDGVVSGNQVIPGTTAPATVTGNSVSLLGDSSSGEPAMAVAPPATAIDDSGARDTDRIRPLSRMFAIGDDSTAQFELAAGVGLEAVPGDEGFSVGQEPAGLQPIGSGTAPDADTAAVVPAVLPASVAGASADRAGVISVADLSTQALADTGANAGNGATAAALLLGAGLMLTTVARRKSLRL